MQAIYQSDMLPGPQADGFSTTFVPRRAWTTNFEPKGSSSQAHSGSDRSCYVRAPNTSIGNGSDSRGPGTVDRHESQLLKLHFCSIDFNDQWYIWAIVHRSTPLGERARQGGVCPIRRGHRSVDHTNSNVGEGEQMVTSCRSDES